MVKHLFQNRLSKFIFFKNLLACSLVAFFYCGPAFGQVMVELDVSPPLCGGFPTGEITALPSGGNGPYSYQWNNGQLSQTISNLFPGNYAVTVTDANGLVATAQTFMTAPEQLLGFISVLSCDLPGILSINATGGVQFSGGGYQYEWSNGETTQTIIDLPAGEYCVTVTDQNSCLFSICESVGPLLTVEVETTPANCNNSTGGTATAVISGGVQPVEILWSNGGTTQTIENLPPGNYTATVIGANGCLAEATGTVPLNSGASFDLDLEVENPTCTGVENGSITAYPLGGSQPYEFLWSNGATTQTADSLGSGIYSVTVTDMLNCSSTASTVLIYLSDMDVSLVGVNPSCAGATNGSVSAFPSGGTEPYSYLWEDGTTNQILSNVGEGTYAVTVTDDLGCSDTASATLVAPNAFSVNVSSSNASECGASNGSVAASPFGGGSPPFSYLWSNGATSNIVNGIPAAEYTVTVTSVQGCTATGIGIVEQPMDLEVEISGTPEVCENNNNGSLSVAITYGNAPFEYNWNNGDSTQTINGLPAGNYQVTVTSTEGCTGSASASIGTLPGVSLELTPAHLTCFENNTGGVQSEISGGTAPFGYLWSNGSTLTEISNTPAGNYALTVTDDNGCSAVETTTVNQPNELEASFVINGSCGANGSAASIIMGGTPIFSYLWSNGGNSSAIYGLAPGDYTLTVTDGNGCTEVETANVPAFPLVELEVTAMNTTCNGTSDGTVAANVNNGTSPFSYEWSNGSTQANQSGLSPGNYSVTVTDGNGCQAFGSAFVALGAGLNVSIDAPTYACPGETVSAEAIASGGIGNFTYQWSNGQTTPTAIDLPAGNYEVTVSDPAGCTGESEAFILPGGMFQANPDQENIACFGDNDGSISLNLIGGATPFNITWSNGATSPDIGNLPAGPYSVTVSDQSECPQYFDFEITEPAELTLQMNAQNGICGELASASVMPGGGEPDYTFLWSNGSTDPFIENLPTGNYAVTITDDNACTIVGSASLEVVPEPICAIILENTVSDVDGGDGQLTAEVIGGNMPYSFQWSNGQTTQTAENLSAENHTVTVTDTDGCVTECGFALLNPGKIGNFVWQDENMDGLQSAGEAGYGGIGIHLTGMDGYGNEINEIAISDNFGLYGFTAQPGTYKLTVDQLPANFVFSNENMGDETLDSDINILTGSTADFQLAEGEVNLNMDIGIFESPCENVSDPGLICCGQKLCGMGEVPAPLTEITEPTGGVGSLEYLWMYSTEDIPFDPTTWVMITGANGANFSPDALDVTTHYVRLVRRLGCGEFIPTEPITITVEEEPIAEITAPDTLCFGEYFDFQATENSATSEYSWSFVNGIPASENAQNAMGITWDTPGEQTVILTVGDNGCATSDTLLVDISTNPIYCENALIITAKLVAPSMVEIKWDYETPDTAGLDFQVIWAIDQVDFEILGSPDLAEPNDTSWHFRKMHESPMRGSNFYRVSLTDEWGETIMSNVAEVVISKGYGRLIEIFPNPFTDKIKVDVFNRFDAIVTIEVFDAAGRQIEGFRLPDEGDYFEISTAHYARGAYFVFVKYDNAPQKVVKLIK